MRCDFFDFVPKFKLWIVGNHKPRLDNVVEAMRRRMLLVPFTVQIPPEERDPNLPAKLKAEWPAILRWAIDGCLEWQRLAWHRRRSSPKRPKNISTTKTPSNSGSKIAPKRAALTPSRRPASSALPGSFGATSATSGQVRSPTHSGEDFATRAARLGTSLDTMVRATSQE